MADCQGSRPKKKETTMMAKRWKAHRNKMHIGGLFVSVSAVGLFQTVAHEAGEQRQHHLWIHFHQIVRQRVDTSSDLTSQWDCVPGRGTGRGDNDLVTNTKTRESGKNSWYLVFLLGVVEFIVLLQHSSLCSLHHVPLDGTGSDDVDQVNHW